MLWLSSEREFTAGILEFTNRCGRKDTSPVECENCTGIVSITAHYLVTVSLFAIGLEDLGGTLAQLVAVYPAQDPCCIPRYRTGLVINVVCLERGCLSCKAIASKCDVYVKPHDTAGWKRNVSVHISVSRYGMWSHRARR
jgi:hypothetical protein